MPRHLSAAIAVLSLVTIRPLLAGPLQQAEVTKIINQVSVVDPQKGDRKAVLRDVIKDNLGLETGKKSRSELLFQDNTLTRIGAETFFSFRTGTRDMTLEKGSMLLQVPKGLGGAKIHTAAVTAAITGTTIMMEYVPNHYIKVLVLEGSLRLSRNGTFGDSLVLRPGKMVIMRPDAKRIPDPVDVDLAHIVATSTLVNFPGAVLPSMPLIQEAIDVQQGHLAKNDLAPTNLVMGNGIDLTIVSGNPLAVSPPSSGGVSAPTAGSSSSTVSSSTVNSVVAAVGNTANSGTGVVGGLLTNATNTTTTVVNDVLGSATSAVNGLLTSTTGTVTNTVDNLLSSTSSTVNNLLGSTSPVTSVAVTSSTEILSLLNNAVQTTTGLVAVAPTTINNLITTVASAPTTVVSPTLSSVTTAVADTTSTATNSATTAVVDTVSSTVGTVSTIPTSIVSSPTTTTTSIPTTALSTIVSAPTTLLTGSTSTTTTSPTTSLLGLGH